MAGRHHRCSEHELGQTPRDGEGQGGLVCCSPWGLEESDTTRRLNSNPLLYMKPIVSELSSYCLFEASLVAQTVKRLPAAQETWV